MPPVTTDVLNIEEAMKIYFTDPINENFVTDTELLDLIMEDNNVQVEQTTGGRYIETAQYFQLPAGVGFRAAGDYLPVPNAPKIRNSRVYLKKGIGSVQMTGDTMRRVKGDLGAYVNYMERALPDFLTRFNDNVDRQLLGYGNGCRARIVAINGNVVTVDRAYGVDGWDSAWLAFQEGESIVASVDADGDPLRNPGASQSAEILDIDPDTNEITFDLVPGAWAPNDFLFGGDQSGTSSQNAGDDREIMGLAGMIDDGGILQEFQGLQRPDYRLWQSHVLDGQSGNFTGDLDEQVMVAADNKCFIRGKGKPTHVVTSREQADRYWFSLKQDRMFIDPKSYEGGRGALFVRLGDRVIPIRVARKMPQQLCYMLQMDTFRRWQLDGGKWDDTTGAIWNRVTDGVGRKDDFYAVYIWYVQTGNIAPAKNIRIDNLTSAV